MDTPRPTGTVPSPCVGICAMDPVSGLCRGCRRTIDEIAVWGLLDDDARRRVMATLPARTVADTEDGR